MSKNPMYYDTHRTKIYKGIYRPSSNLMSFFKSLLAVVVLGNSPFATSENRYSKH